MGEEVGAPPAGSAPAGRRCWEVYWRATAACCGCCCLLLIALAVVLAIFLMMTRDVCSGKSFDAKYVLPSEAAAANIGRTVDLATEANMRTAIPLDFTGIWWIRWADPSAGVQFYNMLHLEEGLTFVGMESNTTGEPWFPAEIYVPSGLSHRWMFSNSLAGRIAMIVASQKDPYGRLTIRFKNSTHGEVDIGGCAWITKLDADRWLRRSAISGCVNNQAGPDAIIMDYELTRIVLADGSLHPVYWPLWLDHMENHQVRVFVEDDQCKRHCGAKTGNCQKCIDACAR